MTEFSLIAIALSYTLYLVSVCQCLSMVLEVALALISWEVEPYTCFFIKKIDDCMFLVLSLDR